MRQSARARSTFRLADGDRQLRVCKRRLFARAPACSEARGAKADGKPNAQKSVFVSSELPACFL